MRHLTEEQLKKDLELRDLSDSTQGEHCMQLIMNEVIDALTEYWHCPATIYRESPIVTVEDNYDKLTAKIKELGLNEADYSWYLDLRKYGSAEHSGFGIGFERLLMYITGIENIRDVTPYPRYDKSCDY